MVEGEKLDTAVYCICFPLIYQLVFEMFVCAHT